MSTVAFIVLIYKKSINPAPTDGSCTSICCCFPNLRSRGTIFHLGMAVICGLILVFWYMVCFALWIAGSYLVIVTIKQMRIVSRNHPTDGCNLSVVGVAGSSIILMWIIFFSFCCSTVYSVFNNNFLRRQEDTTDNFELFGQGRRDRDIAIQQKLSSDHIYDLVPGNDVVRNYNIYDTVTA